MTKRSNYFAVGFRFLLLVYCFSLFTHSLNRCYSYSVSLDQGMWPNDWPRELEPLRWSAQTSSGGIIVRETYFEIRFDDRESFESAWPHLLSVKSPGAPVILERPHAMHVSGGTSVLTESVRIVGPCFGHYNLMGEGFTSSTSPVWPEYLKTGDGALPEYVVPVDGKWVPYVNQKGERFRARVEIVLMTAGKVVDLNRVRLPSNTPIIDKRFKKIPKQSAGASMFYKEPK